MNTYTMHLVIGGQQHDETVEADTYSKAIEEVWRRFGIGVYIKGHTLNEAD